MDKTVLEVELITPRTSKTQFILLECIELMTRKSSDYDHPTRTSGDGLENFRASAELGVPAWVGALTRTSDKWERIKTLTFKLMTKGEGPAVEDETLEDTLKDIINYGAIVLALYREWKIEQEMPKHKHKFTPGIESLLEDPSICIACKFPVGHKSHFTALTNS